MLIEGDCYSYHHVGDKYEVYFNNKLIKSNKVMVEKNEYFTAEEAIKISGSINNENASKQLNTIFGLIKQECNKGQNHTIYNGSMMESVKKHLESLGYTLKYFSGDFREGSYYNISW